MAFFFGLFLEYLILFALKKRGGCPLKIFGLKKPVFIGLKKPVFDRFLSLNYGYATDEKVADIVRTTC